MTFHNHNMENGEGLDMVSVRVINQARQLDEVLFLRMGHTSHEASRECRDPRSINHVLDLSQWYQSPGQRCSEDYESVLDVPEMKFSTGQIVSVERFDILSRTSSPIVRYNTSLIFASRGVIYPMLSTTYAIIRCNYSDE